jgi:RNA polymerase sigma-70 factor (ECF subfamily)
MRVQRRQQDGSIAFDLLDDHDRPIAEVDGFLRHLGARACSSNTLCAYAHDLLRFYQFLELTGLNVDRFGPPEPTRFVEPIWLDPYPDLLLEGIADASPGPEARYEIKETIELAFIANLQQLPPRQRAAVVLRDVLGFHTGEVANMLDSTDDSVKGALKRARATLEQRLPAPGRASAPLPDSFHERELVRRFADAFEADDVDGIVALLTLDAWLMMPPSRLEYQGQQAIASFLHQLFASGSGHQNRLVLTRANTQPAFVSYLSDPHAPISHAAGVMVLTLKGDRISAITRVLDNSALSRFGLPSTLGK